MSAIGNYVYYKMENYTTRDASKFPALAGSSQYKNFINIHQATNSYQHQKQEIARQMSKLGSVQMASKMQFYLNLLADLGRYSGDNNVNAYFTSAQAEKYKKLVVKNLNNITKRVGSRQFSQDDINYNSLTLNNSNIAAQNTLYNGRPIYEVLNRIKSGETVLKKQSKNNNLIYQREQLIDDLTTVANFLVSEVNNKDVIGVLDNFNSRLAQNKISVKIGIFLKTLQQLTGNLSNELTQYLQSLPQEDLDLIDSAMGSQSSAQGGTKKIQNAKERLDAVAKGGLHTKYASADSLLGVMRKMINTFYLPPSNLIGDVTEAAFLASMQLAFEDMEDIIVQNSATHTGKNLIQKVTSNLPLEFAESKAYTKDKSRLKKGFSIITQPDGTYSVVNSGKASKVDVFFTYRTKNGVKPAKTSIKHTNYKEDEIKIIENGNFENLVANNNEYDFLTHYMNIVGPHYNYKAAKETMSTQQLIARKAINEKIVPINKVMVQLIASHAFAGLDTIQRANGKLGSVAANYFAVANTLESGINEWTVAPMSSIYKYIIEKLSGYRVQIGSRNSDNFKFRPFGSTLETLGLSSIDPPEHGDEVISKRINKLLDCMHKRKVSVYLKSAALKRIPQI